MANLEIQTNKARIAFLTFIHLLSLLLAAATVYYIYKLGYISFTLLMVLAIFGLLFPYLLYLNLKIITDTKPGLVINNEGITDNIQITKFGQIPWNNVKGYRMTRVFFSDLMLLDIIDQNEVTKDLSKRFKNMAQNNIKKFGTPCVINVSSLKHDKEELLKIINGHIKK